MLTCCRPQSPAARSVSAAESLRWCCPSLRRSTAAVHPTRAGTHKLNSTGWPDSKLKCINQVELRSIDLIIMAKIDHPSHIKKNGRIRKKPAWRTVIWIIVIQLICTSAKYLVEYGRYCTWTLWYQTQPCRLSCDITLPSCNIYYLYIPSRWGPWTLQPQQSSARMSRRCMRYTRQPHHVHPHVGHQGLCGFLLK